LFGKKKEWEERYFLDVSEIFNAAIVPRVKLFMCKELIKE
jgi:hypothetical protein